MAYFPQINSQGVMVQRPYAQQFSYNAVFVDNPNGRPYSFARRGGGIPGFSTAPLGKFDINLYTITDAEVEAVKAFFTSMEGRLNEFSFLDPAGNLCNYSEDFSNGLWTRTANSILSDTETDPFGGSRASMLIGTTNSSIYQAVLPAGNAQDFVLCGSVWAQANSANQTLSITIQRHTSPYTVWATQMWSLPQFEWVRIYVGAVVGDNAPVRMTIGGNEWDAQIITLFGPQCVPMPGPGAYAKTPEGYGLHARCRFDTDTFTVTTKGVNENQVLLPVVEYHGQ